MLPRSESRVFLAPGGAFFKRISANRFCCLPGIQRRKYQKVSKGGRRAPFCSGSSNRCEQQPVGMGFQRGTAFRLAHDFALQSLVCYTFCDRCRGKGAAAGGQDVSCDSRTGRFCNAVIIAKLFCRGPRKIGDFVGKGGTAE